MLNNVIFGLPLAAIAGGAILAQRGGITRTLPQRIEFPEFTSAVRLDATPIPASKPVMS
jgi:hypothetical protein